MIYTITLNPAVDREYVVPEIEFDTVLRSQERRVDWGGKGFNVSRMLQSLGAASVAMGFAGGKSGEMLQEGMEALGIQTDFVWVSGETRTNVSIVTEIPGYIPGNTPQNTPGHYVKVNEPGPEISAEDDARLRKKVRSLIAPGDWWVLAGSLPPGAPDSIYADLIAQIQAGGARAILDTSGQALNLGCAANPYLVKPNAPEAHQLTGLPVESRSELVAAAQAIQRDGLAHVVISLGKDGALWVDGQRGYRAASPQIEEQNPIGAGDSMVAGLVWALSQGLLAAEALRWGIACGAATTSLRGTAVGSRALVETLLPDVRVETFELQA